MGTRTPSKHLSLTYLKMLQEQDYCNKDKGIDYEPTEVDELVWVKQGCKSEKQYTQFQKEMELKSLCDLKAKKKKYCSKCKKDKPFKGFSPDKSKKFFGLRSWCRDCRSNK